MTTLAPVGSPNAPEAIKDLIGIGIGPFNLSVAALLDGMPMMNATFLDQKSEFVWHAGLMFPGSILQTSFLKDLVTPVLPTSPHSFVNYLVEQKRFYDFMAGRFTGVSRTEFSSYMSWVAHRLPSTRWDSGVREVSFDGEAFQVELDDGLKSRARNLSVATGMKPNKPDWAAPHIGPTCFHASDYLHRAASFSGKRVAVIGGGQTGAEIVLDLLTSPGREPAQVSWISNLPRFSPLEEGGFVDQVFTPGYVSTYQTLPQAAKRSEVAGQKLASDGLTPATIDALYEEIYRRKHLVNAPDTVTLLPGRNVFALDRDALGYRIHTDVTACQTAETLGADVIILAIGAKPSLPEFMAPLADRIDCDPAGVPHLSQDYQMTFDGPSENRIFGLNMGLASHGIVDPQMSLMAWRAGVIVNALAGSQVFDVEPGADIISWPRLDQPVATSLEQAAAAG
ncbi:SidA/IucD/PvdA family monooxygenase [Labrenzia sp. CE80]|uniref:lysine N(6)-hydroxylase/L-ornithine N(5)-oxygenase family protein n=1 Tax=Labrenzia sp. CE80 TaxID=1788986 RepID=UPI00129ABFBB|nr:SidA/IucD/PvdA family monooxygenase [Labrenzia sp. CE80]